MSETEPISSDSGGSVGAMLSQRREEQGLSTSDVAQRTKYAVKQIEALEADDFRKLPGPTFIRGMVRSYARLLDTNPELVLAALDRQYKPGEVSLDLRTKRVPFQPRGKRGTRVYLLASVLLLVLAGVVYQWRAGALSWSRWLPRTAQQQSQPAPRPAVAPPAPPSPAPSAAAPQEVVARKAEVKPASAPAPAPRAAAAASPSSSEGRIRMEFNGESWVEIRDGEGKMIMSQLNPAGSSRVVVGLPPMSLVIGNAAAVRLSYNGKAVDLQPHIEIEVARLTLK